MFDLGYMPSPSPGTCSPHPVPPPPPEPTVPVQVVDVRPEAAQVPPLAPHHAGVSVTLHVPTGILSVPSPANRTPIVAEGLHSDFRMTPEVEMIPPVSPTVPSAPFENAQSTYEPLGHTK